MCDFFQNSWQMPGRRIGNCCAFLSEPKDNSCRESRVILRMAAKIGHQIVSLNYAPMNSSDHFRIDASPNGHRKRGIPESCLAEMRATKKYVREG
jgi:hypothetical protein